MKRVGFSLLCALALVCGEEYGNITLLDAASKQLLEFRQHHPKPVGIITTTTGAPVDIRDTVTLNTDPFNNEVFLDNLLHTDGERIPERVVHAKGGGAFGYFEVTHDVSKYTKADVFNGIGKKTPVFGRFSSVIQSLGGRDASRETKALAVKFYTKEGNLDLVGLNFPIYFYRNPIDFKSTAHSFKKNPKSNLFDTNARYDYVTKRPDFLHAILWLLSDYGIPDSYRRIDSFAVHTFEINNENGDQFYVKFNFRTEQGLGNLTTQEALAIPDLDYYNRDLYNAIEDKNFPSWRLEMDVMTFDDIKKLNYNPFDVTRIWKKGDYYTVTIGRLVLNRNPENFFRTVEQSAFSPSNLVPGIPGPVDVLFKARKLAYRDTQNHRLGRNHHRIKINQPLYMKTYDRDGVAPVGDNMGEVPNYYPNSFSGPVPFVDSSRPGVKLLPLETNAVDLEIPAYFYNEFVKDEGHRRRLVNNLVASFRTVYPELINRTVRLLSLVDRDLGQRIKEAMLQAPPTVVPIASPVTPPSPPDATPALSLSDTN